MIEKLAEYKAGFEIINIEIVMQAYGKYLLMVLMALNELYEPAISLSHLLSLY